MGDKNYNIEDDGFQILKNVTDMILDDIPSIDELINEMKNNSLFCDVFMTEFGPKQIQNLHKTASDDIERLAAYLFRTARLKGDYKILNSQLFIKYPNYKITSPHQDGIYFNDPERTIYTFWIPLQDVSPENSCMHYVPKSNFDGLRKHIQIGSTLRTRTGNTGYSLMCDDYQLDEYIPIPLNFGDVVFHDQLTLHYSSQNKTNEKRVALTLILEVLK